MARLAACAERTGSNQALALPSDPKPGDGIVTATPELRSTEQIYADIRARTWDHAQFTQLIATIQVVADLQCADCVGMEKVCDALTDAFRAMDDVYVAEQEALESK